MAYYKILFCSLMVWGFIEFSMTASSSARPAVQSPLTPKENLVNYYEGELTEINKEFCANLKKLSNQILKVEGIKHANTTIRLEFKNNITEFLNRYESLTSHDLYRSLIMQFSARTMPYDDSKTPHSEADAAYISQLLKTLGFDEMNEDYERKLDELIEKKLLEHFEEYKPTFKEEEFEKDPALMDWYQLIKTCSDPNCHKEAFDKFKKILPSTKEDLYDFVEASLTAIYNYYGDMARNISAEILRKSDLLKHVNTSEIQYFKIYLEELNSNHSYQNIYERYFLTSYFLNMYAQINDVPKEELHEDTKLIVGVIEKFKVYDHQNYFEKKMNEFVENTFIPKFEEIKLKLNQAEAVKAEYLLNWFEQFRTVKTYVERKQAFEIISEIFWS